MYTCSAHLYLWILMLVLNNDITKSEFEKYPKFNIYIYAIIINIFTNKRSN